MFVLKTTVDELKDKIRELEFELSCGKRLREIQIEEARNAIRKEMQKSLIESDLRRVAAESKLETYEKMDTKEERKALKEMLSKAIDGLSNQKVNVVK